MPLSEELGPYWEVLGPLIRFFCLPEQEQIAVLPVLDKRKYDFSDGDLSTDNALEVLINGYGSSLNSSVIRLLTMQDESNDNDIDNLVDAMEQLLDLAVKIAEEYFETSDNLDMLRTSDWEQLRQLSQIAQQKLRLQSGVDKALIRSSVKYWLHP